MKKERWLAALGGVGVGILNGLLGAGGGMLTVPLLEWMGVKGRRAHATSLAVILPTYNSRLQSVIAGRLSE